MTVSWTDEISAYERELGVLEEARAEYAAAARTIVSSVAVRLRARELPRAEGSVLAVAEEDDKGGVGRYRVDVDVSAEGVALLNIQVYVASAYGGSPGTLRLAAYVGDEKAAFASSVDERRLEAIRATGFDTRDVPADVGGEGVAMSSFDIRSATLEQQVADAVGEMLEMLNPVLTRWAEAVTPVARARRGLFCCRDRLLAKPLTPAQVVTPGAGKKQLLCEDGVAYVWMKEPTPAVWVGVRLSDGALVYAHDGLAEAEAASAAAIAKRLRAERMLVGEFDGGVLLSGLALRSASDDEIAARALEAFETFRSVVPPAVVAK